MADTPTRVEVCCDPACENYNIPQEIKLTKAEIAEMETLAIKAAEEQTAREAEAARIEAVKTSARTKLANGEPLTEEEAALLIP